MRVAVSQSETIKAIGMSSQDSVQGMMQAGGQIRRDLHWDIESAVRNLPWLRGSLAAIAKNLVGPHWKFSKVKEYEDEATDRSLLRLKKFYGLGVKKDYKNFKDFYVTSGKFYATAVALALGNFAAWEVKSDSLLGKPMGFEFLPGYIEPQIERDGTFKKENPAFIQYLSTTGYSRIEWEDPNDIVFFARPDFGGFPFASDLESLVQYTFPAEIYSSLSWLAMHKNRNAPLDGYWWADPQMSEEHFNKLEALLKGKYSGARNYARSPILAKGGVEFKPIKRSENEMPYKEGRHWAQQEIAGVTGVPGSKLGVTEALSMANSREAKRDYYETTIEPLQQIIEETTYEQVHVRLLGIRGWRLHFNNPAFVNEVEQSSIDRTYWNIGKVSPNELRERDGQQPYKGGDQFFAPANMVSARGANLPGREVSVQPEQAPSEETTPRPDPLPPQEAHPSGQKPRPVRADEQNKSTELKKWRTVAIKQAKGEKSEKPFECYFIPEDVQSRIKSGLEVAGNDTETVRYVFELAKKFAEED